MKVPKVLLCIVLLGVFLPGCSYETQELSNLKFVSSHKIDRGSDETPYTAIIFETGDKKEKILFDDSEQSKTTLLRKGEKYNVTVSVANRWYYGGAIVGIAESK